MDKKKKLVFFTPVASPHQVKFVPFLRKYFDAEYYFYSQLGGRPEWWRVDLGEHGHLMHPAFTWHGKYITLEVLSILRKEKPDILMLGGFSLPANMLAYFWARLHRVPVVVMTERSRDAHGNPRPYNLTWKLLHLFYRNVTRVMVTMDDIAPQFRDTFHFGDKVVVGRYPSDFETYFNHPVRGRKAAYTLIFANRLTDIYNPVGAVEIFAGVLRRFPKTRLKMNADGELRGEVEKRIKELGIGESVEFLDHLKHWSDLDAVYASCDIMYLPAKFSNGNYTIGECRISGMGVLISDRIKGGSPASIRKCGVGFVLPLDNQAFVDKICWYIEHPEEFAHDAEVNREEFKNVRMDVTAKLYYKLMGDL